MRVLAFLLFFVLSLEALALDVLSLNIEWYGRGGDIYGKSESETRDPFLSNYIFKILPEADVYVFQEIADKERFFNLMKPLKCVSYEASRGHQYIVMCSKPNLLKSYHVNSDVKLKTRGLRPALVGHYEKDQKLYKVVGVHLKAGKQNTDLRLEQVLKLKKDLHGEETTIVIGDFNTHPSYRTGLLNDDDYYVNSLLEGFRLLDDKPYSYIEFGGRSFDKAWYKSESVAKMKTFGPCDKKSLDLPYTNPDYYKKTISDHCAILFSIDE